MLFMSILTHHKFILINLFNSVLRWEYPDTTPIIGRDCCCCVHPQLPIINSSLPTLTIPNSFILPIFLFLQIPWIYIHIVFSSYFISTSTYYTLNFHLISIFLNFKHIKSLIYHPTHLYPSNHIPISLSWFTFPLFTQLKHRNRQNLYSCSNVIWHFYYVPTHIISSHPMFLLLQLCR